MAQRIPVQLITFNDEELDDELHVNCTSICPFTQFIWVGESLMGGWIVKWFNNAIVGNLFAICVDLEKSMGGFVFLLFIYLPIA